VTRCDRTPFWKVQAKNRWILAVVTFFLLSPASQIKYFFSHHLKRQFLKINGSEPKGVLNHFSLFLQDFDYFHKISRYVFWYRWIAQTLLPLMERVRFKKKKLISYRIFDYSGLGSSSFHCELISAQGVTAAHFVAPVKEHQRNGVQI
jgi:hypothetical protein